MGGVASSIQADWQEDSSPAKSPRRADPAVHQVHTVPHPAASNHATRPEPKVVLAPPSHAIYPCLGRTLSSSVMPKVALEGSQQTLVSSTLTLHQQDGGAASGSGVRTTKDKVRVVVTPPSPSQSSLPYPSSSSPPSPPPRPLSPVVAACQEQEPASTKIEPVAQFATETFAQPQANKELFVNKSLLRRVFDPSSFGNDGDDDDDDDEEDDWRAEAKEVFSTWSDEIEDYPHHCDIYSDEDDYSGRYNANGSKNDDDDDKLNLGEAEALFCDWDDDKLNLGEAEALFCDWDDDWQNYSGRIEDVADNGDENDDDDDDDDEINCRGSTTSTTSDTTITITSTAEAWEVSPKSYASATLSASAFPPLAASRPLTTAPMPKASSPQDRQHKCVGRHWTSLESTIDSHTLAYRPRGYSQGASTNSTCQNTESSTSSSSTTTTTSCYDPGFHPGRRFRVIPFEPRAKRTKAQRTAKRSSKIAREVAFELHVLMQEDKAAKRQGR